MEYRSVIGKGRIELLPDEQKEEALIMLMKHYRSEGFKFNRAAIPVTAVYKLIVEECTGKMLIKK